MKRSMIDVWVGLFVLAGIAALIALTVVVSGKKLNSGSKEFYTVYADIPGVGTLKADAPVKMVGIEIGRVKTIELVNVDGEYKARVGMRIEKQVTLPSDSRVAILTAGLLGSQFIGITQGAMINEPIVDGGSLTETQKAMQLEELITDFGLKKAEEAGKNSTE